MCVIFHQCTVCLQQNTQDVPTTLNILCILSELLTVGEYRFVKKMKQRTLPIRASDKLLFFFSLFYVEFR